MEQFQKLPVLADFIKKEDFLYHVVAMRNLFAEHGDRNNKARARIRYIAIKLGTEEFIKLYNTYLEDLGFFGRRGTKHKQRMTLLNSLRQTHVEAAEKNICIKRAANTPI